MSKELVILPEDAATRDLMIGFRDSGRFCDAKVHLVKPGGGKIPTIRQLAGRVPELRRYPNRKILLVLDSDSTDGTVDRIWKYVSDAIAEALSLCFRDAPQDRIAKEKDALLQRVFLFSWDREVEDLKRSTLGQGKISALGQKLAEELDEASCNGIWQNQVFQSAMFSVGPSGQTECDKIRQCLFPLLRQGS